MRLAVFSAEIPESFSKEILVHNSLRTDDWQRLLYSLTDAELCILLY